MPLILRMPTPEERRLEDPAWLKEEAKIENQIYVSGKYTKRELYQNAINALKKLTKELSEKKDGTGKPINDIHVMRIEKALDNLSAKMSSESFLESSFYSFMKLRYYLELESIDEEKKIGVLNSLIDPLNKCDEGAINALEYFSSSFSKKSHIASFFINRIKHYALKIYNEISQLNANLANPHLVVLYENAILNEDFIPKNIKDQYANNIKESNSNFEKDLQKAIRTTIIKYYNLESFIESEISELEELYRSAKLKFIGDDDNKLISTISRKYGKPKNIAKLFEISGVNDYSLLDELYHKIINMDIEEVELKNNGNHNVLHITFDSYNNSYILEFGNNSLKISSGVIFDFLDQKLYKCAGELPKGFLDDFKNLSGNEDLLKSIKIDKKIIGEHIIDKMIKEGTVVYSDFQENVIDPSKYKKIFLKQEIVTDAGDYNFVVVESGQNKCCYEVCAINDGSKKNLLEMPERLVLDEIKQPLLEASCYVLLKVNSKIYAVYKINNKEYVIEYETVVSLPNFILSLMKQSQDYSKAGDTNTAKGVDSLIDQILTDNPGALQALKEMLLIDMLDGYEGGNYNQETLDFLKDLSIKFKKNESCPCLFIKVGNKPFSMYLDNKDNINIGNYENQSELFLGLLEEKRNHIKSNADVSEIDDQIKLISKLYPNIEFDVCSSFLDSQSKIDFINSMLPCEDGVRQNIRLVNFDKFCMFSDYKGKIHVINGTKSSKIIEKLLDKIASELNKTPPNADDVSCFQDIIEHMLRECLEKVIQVKNNVEVAVRDADISFKIDNQFFYKTCELIKVFNDHQATNANDFFKDLIEQIQSNNTYCFKNKSSGIFYVVNDKEMKVDNYDNLIYNLFNNVEPENLGFVAEKAYDLLNSLHGSTNTWYKNKLEEESLKGTYGRFNVDGSRFICIDGRPYFLSKDKELILLTKENIQSKMLDEDVLKSDFDTVKSKIFQDHERPYNEVRFMLNICDIIRPDGVNKFGMDQYVIDDICIFIQHDYTNGPKAYIVPINDVLDNKNVSDLDQRDFRQVLHNLYQSGKFTEMQMYKAYSKRFKELHSVKNTPIKYAKIWWESRKKISMYITKKVNGLDLEVSLKELNFEERKSLFDEHFKYESLLGDSYSDDREKATFAEIGINGNEFMYARCGYDGKLRTYLFATDIEHEMSRTYQDCLPLLAREVVYRSHEQFISNSDISFLRSMLKYNTKSTYTDQFGIKYSNINIDIKPINICMFSYDSNEKKVSEVFFKHDNNWFNLKYLKIESGATKEEIELYFSKIKSLFVVDMFGNCPNLELVFNKNYISFDQKMQILDEILANYKTNYKLINVLGANYHKINFDGLLQNINSTDINNRDKYIRTMLLFLEHTKIKNEDLKKLILDNGAISLACFNELKKNLKDYPKIAQYMSKNSKSLLDQVNKQDVDQETKNTFASFINDIIHASKIKEPIKNRYLSNIFPSVKSLTAGFSFKRNRSGNSNAPKESDVPKQSQASKESYVPKQSQASKESDVPKQFQASKESDVPKQSQAPKESDVPKQSQASKESYVPKQFQATDKHKKPNNDSKYPNNKSKL